MNAARVQSQTGGAPSPSGVRTNTLPGIEAIFDPRINLVVWERDDAGQRQLDNTAADLLGLAPALPRRPGRSAKDDGLSRYRSPEPSPRRPRVDAL
jgi:hypothetical protein